MLYKKGYKHTLRICVISHFRREVVENCALRSYYAASSGNFLLAYQPISRDKEFLTFEDGTDGSSRNVGNKLPLYFFFSFADRASQYIYLSN